MSRSDGSAYPAYPFDSDYRVINAELGRESDELPDAADYEQALWPLLAGEVVQPSCMCGKWSSIGECENCKKEREEWERWDADDAKERAARSGWRKPAA